MYINLIMQYSIMQHTKVNVYILRHMYQPQLTSKGVTKFQSAFKLTETQINFLKKCICCKYTCVYMCIYMYMSLLLYMQSNYCKFQPSLLILNYVAQRFNHWDIFCLDKFVGFFFIILKEILNIYN